MVSVKDYGIQHSVSPYLYDSRSGNPVRGAWCRTTRESYNLGSFWYQHSEHDAPVSYELGHSEEG